MQKELSNYGKTWGNRLIHVEMRDAVLRACRAAMTPIARLCIKVGITQRELAEVSRASFLRAVEKELGAETSSMSVAKISSITGMSRRDIVAADATLSKAKRGAVNWLRLTYILTEWHSNHRYMARDGRPMDLPLECDDGPSLGEIFEKMAPRYSRESLLVDLLGHKCVELRDSRYAIVAREIIPDSVSEQTVIHAGLTMYALGSTIVDNLLSKPGDTRFLERMTVSSSLADPTVPRFLNHASKSGKNLIEVMDAWIGANESPIADLSQKRVVGMGVFAFDVEDPDH